MRAGDWRSMGDFTDLLGLDEFFDTFVRRLSLGQRMRADIAATLLHRPWVLFLDEPTAGLDVVAKAQVRDFLSRMNRATRQRFSLPRMIFATLRTYAIG